MTKKTKAKGNAAKPGRGAKGRGRGMNISLPIIMMGVLRFFGLLLLLMWRGLCKITPPLPVWQRFARSRVTHRVAAILMLAVLCMVALGVMRGSLAQGDKWQLDPARIEFSALELDWVGGEGAPTIRRMIDESLRKSLSDLEATSAFDTEIAERVGKRLSANPWVFAVDRVVRKFPSDGGPSTLEVALRLHKPILRVPLHDRVYFVSRANAASLECHVLPWAPILENRVPQHHGDQVAYAALAPDVRMVSGVWGDAPTIGATWASEQVRAAMSMEEELRRYEIDKDFSVSLIDVVDIARAKRWDGQVEYAPLGGVRLIGRNTSTATSVVWGKALVHASTVEVPVAAKLRKLKDALAVDATLQQYGPTLLLNQ